MQANLLSSDPATAESSRRNHAPPRETVITRRSTPETLLGERRRRSSTRLSQESAFAGPSTGREAAGRRRRSRIESLEEATQQVVDKAFKTLMMPSMRLAAAGVACIVAPLTLLLLAPLTLLLLPILVPLGLLLTAVGVARAGIVVSMDGSRRRARSPRSPADRSGPQAEAASRSEEACATPSSRRKRRASWGSSSREGLPLDRRASSAQDQPPELSPNLPTAIALSAASVPVPVPSQDLTSGAVLDGSLSTLNSLTAQRGGSLVRQAGGLSEGPIAAHPPRLKPPGPFPRRTA